MNSNQRIQGGIVRVDSKCYPVFKGVNTVGRNKTAVVNVKNLNVSQNQALVVLVDENQHFLVDMNSSNGTFLGNTKLVPFMLYELKNDEDIKFADVQAKYLKVSNSNNINNNMLNLTLEMTQNVTQNFYAANTQLMDTEASHLEHNYTNINNRFDSPITDIHEMATQEANFSSYIRNMNDESNKVPSDSTTQIISEEEVITNIHDATTQVIIFREPSPLKKEITGAYINTQKAAIEAISEKNQEEKSHELAATTSAEEQPSNNLSSKSVDQEFLETIILNNIDGMNMCNGGILSPEPLSSFRADEQTSNKSDGQESSETVILNCTDSIKVNVGIHSGTSSPGFSVSQNNITFDESVLNTSKNISISQKTEIEESVIEDNLAESAIDSNSNDSVDFLTNAPISSKVIEEEGNKNLSVSEDINNKQEILLKIPTQTVGSDSDTDIESDCSSIHTVRKKTVQKVPTSNDTENEWKKEEKARKKIFLKTQGKLLSNSSDSETEIESTQDIGIIKKRLKKLDSENESSSSSETDCEGQGLNSKEVQESDSKRESNSTEQNENEEKVCNQDKVDQKTDLENQIIQTLVKSLSKNNISEDAIVDCQEEPEDKIHKKNETETSFLNKDSLDSNSQNTSGDKLNDTDCIPATQDAFAEAFSYRSQGGKSSSTEDFRLGLTQFMEDSLNDEIAKAVDYKANNICEGNDKKELNNQENKDADDIYLMATQHINDVKVPLTARNIEDVDLIGTEQIIKQASVPSTSEMCYIYDMATQQLPETKSTTETEKDDDVYMLATQPINTESQFKLPKTFTFKKKPAVLEESLSTLLGDNNKDDDIFDAPTQRISEFQKPLNNLFDEPTQQFPKTQKQKYQIKEDDIFDAPTQKIAESQKSPEKNRNHTENMPCLKSNDSSPNETLKDPNQVVVDNSDVQSKTNIAQNADISNENSDKTCNQVQDLFDMPTQAFPTESEESSNTQDELEFCNTNNPSTSANNRPDNPLAHVLNEDDKPDTISKVPAIRRSRRKSSSPLPEPSESKRQKKMKKPIKMSKITEEIGETVNRNENSTKKTEGDTSSKMPEDSFNAKSKLLTTIDEDKDDTETLSQIEAFIKKPVVKTYSRTRLSKRTEAKQNVEEIPGSSSTALKETITKSQNTSKRKLSTEEESDKIANKELAVSQNDGITLTEKEKSLRQTRESDENCSYKDQEIVKSDIDQSFALLESKVSKSRKKPIDPVLEDFKVTISSHRRSMGIAETSVIASNKARRATVASNYSRDKRKIQKAQKKTNDTCAESDSSDSEVPKKKVSRGRPKKESTNKRTRTETKKGTSESAVDIKIESEKVTNMKKTGSNFSSITSSKSLSEKEIEDNFEKKNAADIKEATRRTAKLPSKTEETRLFTSDIDTPRLFERKAASRGRSTIGKSNDDQRSHQGTSSESNTSTDVISTPRKQRNIAAESCSSAERAKRKLKPKVVFTMLDNPLLESLIRQLGGSVVDSVNICTVLVTERVKRSQKLLAAVGQGKPVCSPQWIKESKKAGEFLDPWDFILIDREAETKWNFSLKESINRAVNQKLLTDYVFQVIATNGADVLKGAIEACGGKCVSKQSSKNSETNFIVIASPDQKSKYAKTIKQNPNTKVVEPEAIFDGVLRQELRLSEHLLA